MSDKIRRSQSIPQTLKIRLYKMARMSRYIGLYNGIQTRCVNYQLVVNNSVMCNTVNIV